MNKKLLIYLALAALFLSACAKKTVSTTGQDALEYLTLWMDRYYPNVEPNEDGIYILEDTPGTGEVWNSEIPYVCTHYTIRALNGTVSSTTDETLSKQLGTYVVGNYYGPKYQTIGEGVSYAGLDAMLKGMKVGGTRKAVIPAWMLTTNRYATQKAYLDACTVSSSLIYTISLVSQTDDPEADAIDALRDYVSQRYGASVQPCTYRTEDDAEVDGSFYFVSDTSAFAGMAHLASDAKVNINYTGYLLNGTVFDTTLEKVAKDKGIYSQDRTYEPASINYASSWDGITMGSSSSLINGFKGGLSLMHWKGQKATVLFTSKHGYSTSGSGGAIPSYAILAFDLEILD